MTTVLVVGDNCLDRYLPPVDRSFVGGQAVNVAAGLAAAGVPVAYAGVVGDDDAGGRILAELAARGIDTRATAVAAGPTGVTEIRMDGAERHFASERYGVSAPYVPSDAALALAATARLVYAAHVPDLGPVRAAMPPDGELAFDASDDELDERVLRDVDILFRSAPGLAPREAGRLAVALLGAGPATVVLTLGAAGAVAVTAGGHQAACAAAAIDPVDTLGAGDALAAAFLAARLRGAPLGDALAAGNAAAAAACTHLGALPVVASPAPDAGGRDG